MAGLKWTTWNVISPLKVPYGFHETTHEFHIIQSYYWWILDMHHICGNTVKL